MMETRERKLPSGIPEGVLLAVASGSAYLFAYYYEKGFVSFFQIPTYLISVSLANVLTFAGIALGTVIFIFPFIDILVMAVPSFVHPVVLRSLRPLFILVVVVLVQVYLFGLGHWQYSVPTAFLLAFFAVFILVFPLITQRGRANYVTKLEAQQFTDADSKGMLSYVVSRFGPDILQLFLVVLIGTSLSYSAGLAAALRQESYLVTDTTPEFVVLKVYGDNFVCAPFDRNTREVRPQFRLVHVGDPGLVFTLENVGPFAQVRLAYPQPLAPTPLPTLLPSGISTPTLMPTTATP